LPDSIEQTVSVNSKSNNPSSGSSQGTTSKANGSAIYTSAVLTNGGGRTAAPSRDNNAIAQAVKNALLTSNSLGDVIAEL
jgi:hypothetical protein